MGTARQQSTAFVLGLVHIRGLDYIGVIIVELGDVQRGIGFGRIQYIGTVVPRVHEHSHIAAVTVLTPAGVTCGFFPIVLVRQTIGTTIVNGPAGLSETATPASARA